MASYEVAETSGDYIACFYLSMFCKNLRNSSMDIFKTFTAHAYLEGRRTVSTEKYFLENSGSVPKPFRIEALLANLILGK